MRQFLGNLSLDKLSFWLGFLAGTLAWWLLGILRPTLRSLWKGLRAQSAAARAGLTTTTEIRLRNDILKFAQRQHLAAPIFSLDEIFIPVSLLSPPQLVNPGSLPTPIDIAEVVVPYMPDWPEMAAVYGSPQITLEDALKSGAHIVLTGRPGCGKTTLLAHLAAELCRPDTAAKTGQPVLPLPVHVHDLELPLPAEQDPLSVITTAVARYASPVTQTRLAAFLQTHFNEKGVLLIVDGMDESTESTARLVSAFLSDLLDKYPAIQVIVAASPECFPGLPVLGFIPLAMAAWNENQRIALINRWHENWSRYIEIPDQGKPSFDASLLDAWLYTDRTPLSPLELTLKVWSVYAGDNLGPSGANAIEAYTRRMSAGIPNAMPVMQHIASQALTNWKPIFSQKETQEWIFDVDISPRESPTSEPQPASSSSAQPSPTPLVISTLVESGLVRASRDGNRLSFAHPNLLSYLAAQALTGQTIIELLTDHAGWVCFEQTIEYMASRSDLTQVVDHWLKLDSPPLHKQAISAARWLRNAREEAPWRTKLLQGLAVLVQDEKQPLALRTRIMTALCLGSSSGVDTLFRQMFSSPQPAARQIAALAAGLMREFKAVDELARLLDDPFPVVYKAAGLALVAIGTRPALEAVADCLVQGSEDLRQSAARVLANHVEEGHPTLKEGATLEDLLVRKAVVAGLQRVRQPWALTMLEKMRHEDSEWVVKNAANQALEELAQPYENIPHQLPPLTETPWLIAFAGEKGIGVAPGRAAVDLLLLALKEGKEEQRLAALDTIRLTGDSHGVLPVYQVFYSTHGDLFEAAYQTLWHLAASGVSLPPPEHLGHINPV